MQAGQNMRLHLNISKCELIRTSGTSTSVGLCSSDGKRRTV